MHIFGVKLIHGPIPKWKFPLEAYQYNFSFNFLEKMINIGLISVKYWQILHEIQAKMTFDNQ